MSTFDPMDLFRFANAWVVVVGPGWLLVGRLAPDADPVSRGALGVAYGIAIQMCGALLLPIDDGPARWVFVAACWVAAIAAVVVARRVRRVRNAEAAAKHPEGARAGRALVGLLVLQTLALLALTSTWVLPSGNDAVYHVAIAAKLQSAGLWPTDFLPYDPTPPNYPPASHWLCAFMASVTGVAVHRVYVLLTVALLVTVTAMVAALARVWRGPWVGTLAASAFVLGASWGGWDLLRWGSLPNLAGVVLMLASALALIGPAGGTLRSIVLAGPLLAALVETHHLSALIFAVGWTGTLVAGRRVAGLTRVLLVRSAGSAAVALALAAPFLWRYGGQVAARLGSDRPSAGGEVAGPAFLNVGEPAIAPFAWLTEIGPLLWALAAVGLYARLRAPATPGHDADDRPRPGTEAAPTPRDAADAFVLGAAAAIAAAYLGLDWVARPVWRGLSGVDLAIFTPSRFLTDLVYPLAVLAGLGLAHLASWRREAVWAAAGLGLAFTLSVALPLRGPTVPADRIAALQFVAERAPTDVLLLGNPVWAPYLTGREGATTVLRQEALSDHTARKRALLGQGSAGIRAWMRENDRPIWVHSGRALSGPDVELLFERGRERLYRVVQGPGG